MAVKLAKKRKRKEEQYVFKIPEFDREEFVRREIRDAKLSIATIIYAIIFTLLSYALNLYNVGIAFLAGVAGIFTLKFYYSSLGFTPEELEPKHLLGFAVLFFFTWLAAWILLSNPPAADYAAPEVGIPLFTVEEDGLWNEISSDQIPSGTPIRLYVSVHDNVEVNRVSVVISQIHGQVILKGNMSLDQTRDQYFYQFELEKGDYRYRIIAEDDQGHVKKVSGTFKVNS